MKKFIFIIFISISLFANELSINKSYKGKIYQLYSVYSYKEQKDAPVGFLSNNLKSILQEDNEAMWSFRKYQLARIFGSILLSYGFLTVYFKQLRPSSIKTQDFYMLYALTCMAVGYGIGYKYAYHKLDTAIDTFNQNQKSKDSEKPNQKTSHHLQIIPLLARAEAGILLNYIFTF